MRRLDLNQFAWLAFFPCLLLLSLYMAWQALCSQDFLYEELYDSLDIQSFIERYAPQNRYKKEFIETSREERIRVFSLILEAINSSEKESELNDLLSSISYFSTDEKEIDTLLRKPEVEHLVFVALLVNKLKLISLCIAVLFFSLFLYIAIKNIRPPSWKQVLVGYSVFIALLVVGIFLIGPKNVFVFFHEQFFEGHQWFFYYQESLMTTLMMAPTLFAYFAAIWGFAAIVIFYILSFLSINFLSGSKKR